MKRTERLSFSGSALTFLLWVYAASLWLVWFAPRWLPDRAVVIRLGASLVSDLVWFPLGMTVWGMAFVFILKHVTSGKRTVSIAAGAAGAVLLVIASPEWSFRLLFAPLSLITLYFLFMLIATRTWSYWWRRVLPFALIVTATIVYYGYQLVNMQFRAYDDTNGVSFTVMTYNILGNATPESRRNAMDIILREHPDIVCCTEYNPQTDPAFFGKDITRHYPYMVTNRDATVWRTGEIILSRYPIEYRFCPTSLTDNHISAVIHIDNREIRIVNLHLTRVGQHGVTDSLTSLYAKAIKLTEFESINDRRKLAQAKEIIDSIANDERPAILSGDFNDTPNGQVYRLFSNHYTDAFSARGWGLGATFGAAAIRKEFSGSFFERIIAKDIIRIDHIFVSSHFKVESARVVTDAVGSDHKPVMVRLRIME